MMWTAVTALVMLSVVEHAQDVAGDVRSRVVADAIVLTAVVAPQHASFIASQNHAVLRKVTPSDDADQTCVEASIVGRLRRACAQKMTPTLDD